MSILYCGRVFGISNDIEAWTIRQSSSISMYHFNTAKREILYKVGARLTLSSFAGDAEIHTSLKIVL